MLAAGLRTVVEDTPAGQCDTVVAALVGEKVGALAVGVAAFHMHQAGQVMAVLEGGHVERTVQEEVADSRAVDVGVDAAVMAEPLESIRKGIGAVGVEEQYCT